MKTNPIFLFPLLLWATGGCIHVYERYRFEPPPPLREAPLTSKEILHALESGVSTSAIEGKVQTVGVEKLTSESVVSLKKEGVADSLLEEMIRQERPPLPVRYRPYQTLLYSERASYYYPPLWDLGYPVLELFDPYDYLVWWRHGYCW